MIEILLGFFVILSIGLGYLIYLMNAKIARYESYILDMHGSLAIFTKNIENLFKNNLMYYDDTIFEFIDSTKHIRDELSEKMEEFEDIKYLAVQPPEPEEEPREILGVVRKGP